MSDEFFLAVIGNVIRALIFSAAAIWIAYIMRPVLIAAIG